MANRIILNETSYFGWGSREVLVDEIKKRKYKKALLVTDETLLSVGVTTKVLSILDENEISYEIFSDKIVVNFNRELSLEEEYIFLMSIFGNYDVEKVEIFVKNEKKPPDS